MFDEMPTDAAAVTDVTVATSWSTLTAFQVPGLPPLVQIQAVGVESAGEVFSTRSIACHWPEPGAAVSAIDERTP
jgi:hypothetical protein